MVDDAPEHLSFTPPPGWRRREIVAFEEADAAGKANPASVVVIREPLPEGETLRALAERHLLEVRELRGVRLDAYRAFECDGAPAVELAYEWFGDLGPMTQTTTLIETQCEGGPVVTSVTTTCAAQDADDMLPVFAELRAGTRVVRPRTVSAIVPKDAPEPAALAEIPIPGVRGARR